MPLAELHAPLLQEAPLAEPQLWWYQAPEQQSAPVYEAAPQSADTLTRQLQLLRSWNEQRDVLEQRYEAIKQGYFMDFREFSNPEQAAAEEAPFYDAAVEMAAQEAAARGSWPPVSGTLELPSEDEPELPHQESRNDRPPKDDSGSEESEAYGRHYLRDAPLPLNQLPRRVPGASLQPQPTADPEATVEVPPIQRDHEAKADSASTFVIPHRLVIASINTAAEQRQRHATETPLSQATLDKVRTPRAKFSRLLGSAAVKGLVKGVKKFFMTTQPQEWSAPQTAPGLYIQN